MSTASHHDALCTFLPWDTEFFGFRIGRVNPAVLTNEVLMEVLQLSSAERLRCLYFAANGESAETLALAAAGGFQFVDVRLDLLVTVSDRVALPPSAPVIRRADAHEIDALARMAKRSHLDSRFFKDRGFPVHRAEELYAEWIRRDHRQHAVLTAICPTTGEPAGYVTCQISAQPRSGRISLIAVAASHQGRGVGRALVEAALDWFHTAACTEVRVATQASNVAAQRLYQAAGFRTVESTVWYHRWFPLND